MLQSYIFILFLFLDSFDFVSSSFDFVITPLHYPSWSSDGHLQFCGVPFTLSIMKGTRRQVYIMYSWEDGEQIETMVRNGLL